MSDFFIVVSVYSKPGREEELRSRLIEVAEPSRRDEGNLRYELLEDQDDPRRFVFIEHWASPEAQHKHHTQTAHIQKFNEVGADAVDRVEFFYKLNRIVH